jgi:hypothetical protein
MIGPQISVRPYVEISGLYDTGLSAVSLDAQGNIATQASPGTRVAGGISGSHSWEGTSLGLSYRGSYSHYTRNSRLNSTDQSLLLGITHQLISRTKLVFSEAAGIINRDYGLLGTISPAVPFDPAQASIPTTDFFNNRTYFLSSQADVVMQQSDHTSLDLGGGLFVNRRASQALYGFTGGSAHADWQARLSGDFTIGAGYSYTHLGFTRIFGSTDMHGVAVTFAYRLSQWWEITGYGGVSRVETKFVQTVALDPAIAAILGVSRGNEVVYGISYVPNVNARLSRTFQKGVLYAHGGHTITPGNGLFLTSRMAQLGGGYTYTGLRLWSFGATVGYDWSDSIGNVVGNYRGFTSSVTFSRQISGSLHLVAGFNVRTYKSTDFIRYNANVYSAHLGFGWTPGNVPLRIW